MLFVGYLLLLLLDRVIFSKWHNHGEVSKQETAQKNDGSGEAQKDVELAVLPEAKQVEE